MHPKPNGVQLDESLEALLRALPDPGDEGYRPAVRAADLVAKGLPGYPVLDMLAECGYALSNRGWWRKTREGVLYLRERDAEALAHLDLLADALSTPGQQGDKR